MRICFYLLITVVQMLWNVHGLFLPGYRFNLIEMNCRYIRPYWFIHIGAAAYCAGANEHREWVGRDKRENIYLRK